MFKLMQRACEEEGFTLIELMVVVLIIAILIAIAIPTFLGARKRAQDRAAQSSLRNTLTSAKTIFTDAEDYTQATTTALQTAEPSLSFVSSATTLTSADPATKVSINAVSASEFVAVARSKSGACFAIRDRATGSAPNAGTTYATVGTGDCNAANAEATGAVGTTW